MRKLPPSVFVPEKNSNGAMPAEIHGLSSEESLADLYDRYAPQVERWARRLAGPTFDAEDLVHDIFLVVLRRHREFRGEAKIATWLFRITAQVVRWRRRNNTLRRWLWGVHGAALTESHVNNGPTRSRKSSDAKMPADSTPPWIGCRKSTARS
jgi:DNA-directed RNA polymerase specialized sigma24 family protein